MKRSTPSASGVSPLSVNDWRGIADFIALRRNMMLLLAALVLAGTGERLWLGFAPKYLENLGAGVFIIGREAPSFEGVKA